MEQCIFIHYFKHYDECTEKTAWGACCGIKCYSAEFVSKHTRNAVFSIHTSKDDALSGILYLSCYWANIVQWYILEGWSLPCESHKMYIVILHSHWMWSGAIISLLWDYTKNGNGKLTCVLSCSTREVG